MPRLGIGLIGSGFMGRAPALAFRMARTAFELPQEPVVEILAETGHGMVTYDRGLNAGLQIAAGRDVKAAAVFREFDAETFVWAGMHAGDRAFDHAACNQRQIPHAGHRCRLEISVARPLRHRSIGSDRLPACRERLEPDRVH